MPEQNDIPTPTKSTRQNRTARVEVRFTATEKQALIGKADAATGGDLSEFVRAAALNKHLKPATGDRHVLIQLLGELGKIGSNVNQIAKTLNQGEDLARPAIIRAADAVTDCADRIRHILSNGKI